MSAFTRLTLVLTVVAWVVTTSSVAAVVVLLANGTIVVR
jgi:hypothetical protein